MNRLFLMIFAAAMLAGGGFGCRSAHANAKATAETAAATNESEVAPGIRIGNEILEAIQKNHYEQFIAAYGSDDKKMTKEEFEGSRTNIEKQFGQIKSFTYLTELKTPLVKNYLFLVSFERIGSDGKEVIIQELLFRLLTGEVDGKMKVIGMGFL